MQKNQIVSRSHAIYTAAWRQSGPGILIALMFIIIASATMLREQSAAQASHTSRNSALPLEKQLSNLLLSRTNAVFHTVRLELPMQQLRDSDGEITPNGESLFSLLARRARSRSLNITFTTNSLRDAEFAATIAARMMGDVSLQTDQLRIGVEEQTDSHPVQKSILIVTITMRAAIDGEVE
jgi:hypothetical protein